jgi:hypothetical protein
VADHERPKADQYQTGQNCSQSTLALMLHCFSPRFE